MALQAQDIVDLVASTLPELGENKFTDVLTDYQNTIALKRTMKKGKMDFKVGDYLQFNLMTDHNHSARTVGLYAQDVVDVRNVMTTGNVPWRHVTYNWAYDRREISMNRSPRAIYDLLKTRRIAGLASSVVLFEQKFWRTPSSDDTESPYGVEYWNVKSATEGFNGTVPSGFTSVGGISPTTYARWRNWTNGYSAVTMDDLVTKIEKAMDYTDFEPIVDDIPQYTTGDDYGLYTNYAVYSPLKKLLRAQNENLGNELDPFHKKVIFRRTPVVFVKELDLDTTNPVHGLNWGEIKCTGLRGEWMYETPIKALASQHTVSAVHVDCSFNWICRNRRRNFVLSNGTTPLA